MLFVVKCPAGTYFNIVSEKCESCAIGTYQAKEGHLTCLVCPRNTSTTSDNTKTIKECKGKIYNEASTLTETPVR